MDEFTSERGERKGGEEGRREERRVGGRGERKEGRREGGREGKDRGRIGSRWERERESKDKDGGNTNHVWSLDPEQSMCPRGCHARLQTKLS